MAPFLPLLVTRSRGRGEKMLRDTSPFLRSLSVGVSFFVSLYHAFGQTCSRTKRIPRIGLVNNSELPPIRSSRRRMKGTFRIAITYTCIRGSRVKNGGTTSGSGFPGTCVPMRRRNTHHRRENNFKQPASRGYPSLFTRFFRLFKSRIIINPTATISQRSSL